MGDEEEEESCFKWLEGDSLAPPCQAELDVVTAILDLASPYLISDELPSSKILFDLGCGDGRICTSASKRFHCKSVGCEVELPLVEKFKLSISKGSIEYPQLHELVKIIHGDLREMDISNATVIVLYLLPESIQQILEMLVNALKNGSFVICNTWGPKSLTAVRKVTCGFANNVTLLAYDKSSLPPSLL